MNTMGVIVSRFQMFLVYFIKYCLRLEVIAFEEREFVHNIAIKIISIISKMNFDNLSKMSTIILYN